MPTDPFPPAGEPGGPQDAGRGPGPSGYDPAKGPPSYGPGAQRPQQQGPPSYDRPGYGPPPAGEGHPPMPNLAERAQKMANLTLNCELVEAILCGFIRSEIYRTGFRRAVVGLSGGVDSSVVTYLAAIALGTENVLAVTMPYKTSSEATRNDSQLVIERLGVQTIEVPITAQIDAYFEQFPDASQLRRANKCARERMTILYDQSAVFEGLVLGTSNKSELLLGYGTQFGDMASAINPIGDVYKTQLYELGRHLGVPEPILSKQPTGDLWIGQTDEEELGFSYAEVDRMLYLLVDCRWHLPELLAAGYEQSFVERVAERVRRNHYKRRLPIIAKLSHRTMDRDFRYARDWGT